MLEMLSHLLVLSTKLSNYQMVDVIADHMCSTMAVTDQSEAKMLLFSTLWLLNMQIIVVTYADK